MKLALLPIALIALAAVSANAQLLAAAGKVEITPTRGCYLAGYGSNRRSTGAHDPLWARCLVLRNGRETIALVVCDLIGVSRQHIQRIRAQVRRVPQDRVIIGATHTHSGPDTFGQWGPNERTSGVDQRWMGEFYGWVADLVDRTAASVKPATVKFGTAHDLKDCSYNARIREVLDTELDAMQVVGADGKTIATLVNYACHPEILDNHLMTSDFPNWLRQTVEASVGGVAIYSNGAQGGMVTADIQHEETYPKGEAWPEAERIGKTLGEAALNALKDAQPVADPALTFRRITFDVPMTNVMFRALMDAGVFPADMLHNGNITTDVCRFTIGPAGFVTLPGEVLPNIGLFLRHRMSGSPRFLLGLTEDELGYILTPEDFGLQLYHYESSVSIGPEMGSRMEQAILALLSPVPAARPAQ